ncbi:MAG: hypothetical protein ACYS6Z_12340 [Planctomycetota bacterium]
MRWLFVLAVVALPASADELTVSAIVKTIRFHPTGEPARVGFKVLSRRGLPGWKALASLTAQLLEPHREVAHAAARALAEGPEPQRLVLAAQTYKRLDDPAIRAILAVGLAYGYEDHRMLLLKHLRENRRGAPAVLEVLAPKILPEPGAEHRQEGARPGLLPALGAATRLPDLSSGGAGAGHRRRRPARRRPLPPPDAVRQEAAGRRRHLALLDRGAPGPLP